MKKYIFVYILIIFASICVVNPVAAQDFGSWVIPPYRIDFYDSGPVVTTGLTNPDQQYTFSDAGLKSIDDLYLYVVDNNIYDNNSQLIANLNIYNNPAFQYEVEIINVPGQNNIFYMIWGYYNYPIGSLRYAKIDCSGTTPQLIFDTEITNTIENVSIAITEMQNNIRFMYVAKSGGTSGGLYRYKIDNTGISFDQTIVTESDPILNNSEYFTSHNLELNENENTLAWCSSYLGYPQNIYTVSLDANGNFASSSIIPLNVGFICGIEFADEVGSDIIYASCASLNGLNGGIFQANYLTGQVGTQLTTNESYARSFLQKAADGYIYAVSNNGDNLGRIDPIFNTFTPSVISQVNIKSSQSSSYNIFKLPENRTVYSILDLDLSATDISCPGHNDGTATATPIGGTPPYTYLWSPDGQTTQTITNLEVGTYSCCVTDAIGDEVCKNVEVTLPPNLFDYEDEFILEYSITLTNWDKSFVKGIRILPNANVTMNNCNLQFGKSAKIVIEHGGAGFNSGGKLTLNNCTLSHFEDCGEMWQGIEVWGNNYYEAYHQYTIEGINAQGQLIITNNTIIENAISAVELWKPGNYLKTGGIIKATDAIFRNNSKSVHAGYYTNFHPYITPKKETDNVSYFNYCTFEINEGFLADQEFFKHVDLASVNGISFLACDFSLENVPGVDPYNHGIAAYSAGFRVYAKCLSTAVPCDEWDKCTFYGFNNGIFSSNTLNTYTFSVNRAVFESNTYGIKVNGVDNLSVLFSNFNIAKNSADEQECDGKGQKASGYGIDLTGCTGFAIEENYFTPGSTGGLFTGIRIAETQATDEVYKNTFDGLSYGNYAVGKNWKTNNIWEGLAYFCNENTGNWRDVEVASGNPSGIQAEIGSTEMTAGNTFTSNADNNFNNLGNHEVGYFYYTGNPPEYPEVVYHVAREPVGIQNQCLSHYGGGGSGRGLVLTPGEKQQAEQDFSTNLTDYNNVKALYDNLKDGGNTDATLSDVETAWPNDMWELRTELLGKSPHLSMEVLKAAADKTDVLPESIIFEIMAANPDELKKEELIKYLEDKENPLPNYMIDILRQVSTGTTYKTVLHRQMAHYNQVKTRAAHDIIRSILNDTITDYADLRNWFDNIGGKRADEQIIASYMQEGNTVDAMSLANMMPTLYAYEDVELTEHNYYTEMLNLQITLANEGRTIIDLDSIEVNNLVLIADNSNGTASTQAKGILEFAYGYHYCECIDSDTSGYKSSSTFNPNAFEKMLGIEIAVEPNPAKDWAAFNFTLPDSESEGVIKISDVTGKLVNTIIVTGKQGQKIWDTRKIKSGVYFYTLNVSGFDKSGKIVISK